jgi:hypothetical protein
MRIVILLLSLLVAAMGAAAILAPGGHLPVAVLSLEKEPLLSRGAALIRDSPGRLKRLDPTQGIKTGYC